MQLLRLTDVPPVNQSDRVFLYSRFRALLGAALLTLSALCAFLFAWFNGAWLGYYIAGIILILLVIFQNLITARFRPSNWLARATEQGIFIKFRSYLNHHFDDRDLTVVFFSYGEILSGRSVKEIQELPDREEHNRAATTTRTRHAIELDVSEDCLALSKLLANERERIFAKSVVGAGTVSTRYQHLPVRLLGARRLRIDWGVVPSAQTLVELLTRHAAAQEPTVESKSLDDIEGLSRQQQETRLLELVESGEMISAVTLARRLYSYDLTAAKRFVEELARRQSARKQE